MKRFPVTFYLLAIAIVLALPSCNDDEKKPDCGCDGATTLAIEKANATYIGDGFFSIQQTNEANEKYSRSFFIWLRPFLFVF